VNLYHVDRKQTLVSGQVLELTRFNDILLTGRGVTDPTLLQRHVDDMFPQGVSRHGDQYFLGHQSLATVASPSIELTFEYVRRAYFPDKPSRFVSWFAADSLDGARAIRTRYFQGVGRIWHVTGGTAFRADMQLLHLRGSILQISQNAHTYWSGAGGQNPQWEYLLTAPVTVLELIE
jgi:hypothetical protein